MMPYQNKDKWDKTAGTEAVIGHGISGTITQLKWHDSLNVNVSC